MSKVKLVESFYRRIRNNLLGKKVSLTNEGIVIEFSDKYHCNLQFSDSQVAYYFTNNSLQQVFPMSNLNNLLSEILPSLCIYMSDEMLRLVEKDIRNKQFDTYLLRKTLMHSIRKIDYRLKLVEVYLRSNLKTGILTVNIYELYTEYTYDITSRVTYQDFIEEMQRTLDCSYEFFKLILEYITYYSPEPNLTLPASLAVGVWGRTDFMDRYALVYNGKVVGFRLMRNWSDLSLKDNYTAIDIDVETARYIGINQFACYYYSLWDLGKTEGLGYKLFYNKIVLQEVNGVLMSDKELFFGEKVLDLSGDLDRLYNIMIKEMGIL